MKSTHVSTLQWLLGVAALFLINACGGAAAPPAIDACAILTQRDAEAILGQPVKAPEHPIEGSAQYVVTSCAYSPADSNSFDGVTVIISVPHDGAVDGAQLAYRQHNDAAQSSFGVAPVDVAGIGDSASWVGGSGNVIAILRGNLFVTLSASNYQGETPPPPVIDLAKLIVGRLP